MQMVKYNKIRRSLILGKLATFANEFVLPNIIQMAKTIQVASLPF